MSSSHNPAAAREIMNNTQTEDVSAPPRQKQTWRFWSGVCFAIVLLVVFAWPLFRLISYVAGSQLHSYVLLVPFVSAYLLYLRRDQLPKNHRADLPLTIVSLAAGLALRVFIYWLDFLKRAPSD